MDYSVLSKFGLSKLMIACYGDLFTNGTAKASELQERLQRPSSSIYLALNELSAKGFLSLTKTTIGPTYFSAVTLDEALENFHQYYLI